MSGEPIDHDAVELALRAVEHMSGPGRLLDRTREAHVHALRHLAQEFTLPPEAVDAVASLDASLAVLRDQMKRAVANDESIPRVPRATKQALADLVLVVVDAVVGAALEGAAQA